MIEIRPFDRLGKANHGWLDTSYHFSFSGYHDPARMGWGALRVWNDDWIEANSGFPPHPHRDMEIITYVRKGAISHRDSLGNEGRTAAGDVQVMSAGTGITHAEYNNEDEATELFQIWILPDRQGDEPRWGQRAFPTGDRAGRWVTLADGRADARADTRADGPADGRGDGGTDGSDDVLSLNADARLLAATLSAGASLHLELDAARHYYLVPVNGAIVVNGQKAGARDGVAISGEAVLDVTASDDVELVLVDTR